MAIGMYPPDLVERLSAALEPSPSPSPAPGDRLAAVLAPLVLEEPGPSLVFARRSDDLSRHAGEISFPGGLQDEGERLAETALREAAEEIGLAPDAVNMLGALSPVHTFVSGILIVPFVGTVLTHPALAADGGEIAEVLEFPVARLAEAERTVEWERDGGVYRGFAYDVGGHTIWGATGRILHELLDIWRELG